MSVPVRIERRFSPVASGDLRPSLAEHPVEAATKELGEPKKRVVPGQKLSPSALSYVIRKSMQQVLLKKLLEKEDGWTGIQNRFRVTG